MEEVSNASGLPNTEEGKDDPRRSLLPAQENEHHHQIAFWKCLTSNNLCCGISLLPITLAILVVSALVINYAIAVSLDHVSPLLPYVSWLASKSPEQYIFDFLFSLASINIAFIIYMKFKVLSSLYGNLPWMQRCMLTCNKFCAWFGLATGFFFLISTTFPAVDEPSIHQVHGVASIVAFVILCIYFIIESVMSFYIRNNATGVTTCLCVVRSVIAALCTICLILSGITGNLSYKHFKGDEKKWRPSDEGYSLHLIAAFCEWLIVLLMVAFFLTYITELKHLKSNVRITLRDNEIHTSSGDGRHSSDPVL